MRSTVLILVFLLYSSAVSAIRLSGHVSDEKGLPLPFTSVYAEGTGKGATANSDGDWFFDLPEGAATLTFRFVGYKALSRQVTVGPKSQVINVSLLPEATMLKELTVTTGGEDPAYAIIRHAQKMRKTYLNQVDEFKCRAYLKGLGRMISAPKKILGEKVEIEGADSNNAGIFYLSEAVSDYYYKKPKEKEVMIASKTSGKPRGFSWNNYRGARFDFYKPLIDMGGVSKRGFVSPVSPSAMLYYRFHLIESFKERGIMVHKIEVEPRRKTDPAFTGTIYIQENTWRIHSLNLEVTRSSGLEYVDTVRMKTVYIPVNDSIWLPGNQQAYYHFDVFGFKGNGYAYASLTNYKITPKLEKKFFGSEVMTVLPQSNKKTDAFWDSVRAVPLTVAEIKDYHVKDSIVILRSSETYLDSIDRKGNKFEMMNIINGYSWNNSFHHRSTSVSGLLGAVTFNTVEGLVLNPDILISKRLDTTYGRTEFSGALRYGFSGKQLYGQAGYLHTWNPIHYNRLEMSAGRYVAQFNNQDPISALVNLQYTLFNEQNFMKHYERRYVNATWQRDLFNGFVTRLTANFERRLPLENTNKYTFNNIKDRAFTANNPPYQHNVPDSLYDPALAMAPHNSFVITANFQYRIGQKYMSRPDGRINIRGKYPVLSLNYRRGIPGIFNSVADFDVIRIGVRDNFNLGLIGHLHYEAGYGTYLSKAVVPFADAKHFLGNRTLYAVNRANGYQLLDYYNYSTTNAWVEAHCLHNFGGFILNKIPLMRRLHFTENAYFNYLNTKSLNNYMELGVGLGNIMKIISVDYVRSFNRQNNSVQGIRVSVGL
ncbi:MAG: DUF5686 and carboxypeptidase regulatory-like domain-containing protein [Bacteroidota bacterium]